MRKRTRILGILTALTMLTGISVSLPASAAETGSRILVDINRNDGRKASYTKNANNWLVDGTYTYILIEGGSFDMGSPDSENWRIADEQLHEVTVSAFYIDPFEAVQYANARSNAAGLDPAYTIADGEVIWDRSANGYRLPTEAEWEYACRAGTETPFNTEHSLSADDANF